MDTLSYTVGAIGPILLMIAAGYVFRRVCKWDVAFFKKLNKLGFSLFLPVNMFLSIYKIEYLSAINWPLTAVAVGGVALCLGLGILAAQTLPQRNQRGVMVQASFRSNSAIVGLPLAEGLGGAESLAFTALITGVCVPIYNILAVTVLVLYAGAKDHKLGVRGLVGKIFQNPILRGCLVGIVIVLLRQFGVAPAWFLRDTLTPIYKVLQDLGKAASPIMLFCLGACLDFHATGRLLPQITMAAVLRLVASPVLVIGFTLLFREPLGMTPMEMPAFVGSFATPVALSSAVMAQELGGDDQLASQIVVWTSVASMGTMFVLIYALRSMGAL